MNENINLVEILKDAPKGTKLYSPLCGECTLHGIDMSSDVPIRVEVKGDGNNGDCLLFFAANGKYFNRFALAECLLLPSKENLDWQKFEVPKKHKEFKPFQKVLRVDDNSLTIRLWATDFYSHYDGTICKHFLTSGFIKNDNEILPYEGNEDKVGRVAE